MNAVVLAGGKSRRFGRDKLIEPLLGKPLIQHVIDRVRLSKVISHVYIAVTPGREGLIKHVVGVDGLVIDTYSSGPAGGVLAALKSVGSSLILGGDMPLINPRFINEFISECLMSGGLAACTPSWGNYLEPLHTLYFRRALSFIEAAALNGESLQRVLARLASEGAVKLVRADEFRNSFMNVNSRHDLRKAESMLKHSAT